MSSILAPATIIYIILFVIMMIFVMLFMNIVKKIAIYIGAMDIPDKRKVHKAPIPRLGGLGIYVGFLLGYMIFGEQTPTMNAILIGSFILLITGIIDDIKPMKASHKLFGQLLASLIVVFYGNLFLRDVSFFGIYFNLIILL